MWKVDLNDGGGPGYYIFRKNFEIVLLELRKTKKNFWKKNNNLLGQKFKS